MLVDRILEYYGRNPKFYSETANGDKWIIVASELFVSSFVYFPIVFGLLPLIYLFIKRKQYKRNKKKFIAKIIFYPIGGAIVGFIVLWVLIGISASLAARDLYGG